MKFALLVLIIALSATILGCGGSTANSPSTAADPSSKLWVPAGLEEDMESQKILVGACGSVAEAKRGYYYDTAAVIGVLAEVGCASVHSKPHGKAQLQAKLKTEICARTLSAAESELKSYWLEEWKATCETGSG